MRTKRVSSLAQLSSSALSAGGPSRRPSTGRSAPCGRCRPAAARAAPPATRRSMRAAAAPRSPSARPWRRARPARLPTPRSAPRRPPPPPAAAACGAAARPPRRRPRRPRCPPRRRRTRTPMEAPRTRPRPDQAGAAAPQRRRRQRRWAPAAWAGWRSARRTGCAPGPRPTPAARRTEQGCAGAFTGLSDQHVANVSWACAHHASHGSLAEHRPSFLERARSTFQKEETHSACVALSSRHASR